MHLLARMHDVCKVPCVEWPHATHAGDIWMLKCPFVTLVHCILLPVQAAIACFMRVAFACAAATA